LSAFWALQGLWVYLCYICEGEAAPFAAHVLSKRIELGDTWGTWNFLAGLASVRAVRKGPQGLHTCVSRAVCERVIRFAFGIFDVAAFYCAFPLAGEEVFEAFFAGFFCDDNVHEREGLPFLLYLLNVGEVYG